MTAATTNETKELLTCDKVVTQPKISILADGSDSYS